MSRPGSAALGSVPLFHPAGRRRYRRDQPRASLAVGAPQPEARRRRAIPKELVRQIVREENDKVKAQIGKEAYAKGRYEDAAQLMIGLVERPQFCEFLTLPAYDRIIADEKAAARTSR